MSSIDVVLSCLVGLLENSLQAKSAREEAWILPGSPAGNDRAEGRPQDRVFAVVLSITGDNALSRFETARPDASGRSVDRSPPLCVDVDVAFVADFQRQNYAVGLRSLSEIIAVLQDKPVIEAEDSPTIAEQTGRLPVEMVGLDVAQSSQAASMLGLKGQPFVVYRLRRLPFRGGSFRAVSPAVEGAGGPGPTPRR